MEDELGPVLVGDALERRLIEDVRLNEVAALLEAVEAYLAVADSLARPGLCGRAWNAGTGVPVSVIEVVERLIAASGRELEPDVRGSASPAGEIDRQWLDSTAIRRELGWLPTRELGEGHAGDVRVVRGDVRRRDLGGSGTVIWWRLRSASPPAAA